MTGFIVVMFALLLVGSLFALLGLMIWGQFTINGQRWFAKQFRWREIQRGHRLAKVYDGLDDELIQKHVEKEQRKQARRSGR